MESNLPIEDEFTCRVDFLDRIGGISMHFRIIRVTLGGGNRRVSNAAGVLLSYHQMPTFPV